MLPQLMRDSLRTTEPLNSLIIFIIKDVTVEVGVAAAIPSPADIVQAVFVLLG